MSLYIRPRHCLPWISQSPPLGRISEGPPLGKQGVAVATVGTKPDRLSLGRPGKSRLPKQVIVNTKEVIYPV